MMAATKYIALIAGALLATTAIAGGDKDHSTKSAEHKFTQLDTDQDGSISRSEAANDRELTAVFASVDADGDGEISESEYSAYLGDDERTADTSGEEY